LKGVRGRLSSVKRDIDDTGESLHDVSESALESKFKAKLIDQESLVSTRYQLAQIAGARATLDAREEELVALTEELDREVDSLRGLKGEDGSQRAVVTAEVARLRHEIDQAHLNVLRQRHERDALARADQAIAHAIARYDGLIAAIESAPLLRALRTRLTIAFVPYENLGNAQKGAAVYGCRLSVVWCPRIGTVGELLDGEVTARHPLFGSDMRGQMVELLLDDAGWATESVLHVGRRPLGI
jgi:hypothetical protein